MREIAGRELALREVSQILHFCAIGLSAPVTGAMHITCADESENECVDRFQQGFVQYLLPPLKFARRAAFRLANLGGRYEWGAVRLAEEHFAGAASDVKLLVVKINAHAALEESERPSDSGPRSGRPPFRLGVWERYGRDSTCCGALDALLRGAQGPAVRELRDIFQSEGCDRIGALLDDGRVDPLYRPLFAAIVSARLQARQVVLDVQDYAPVSPTFFLILPCVTINRHGEDTELVAGLYTIDGRAGGREAIYSGLGDDPAAYEIDRRNGLFVVSDDHVGRDRQGRDHRALVREQWRQRGEGREAAIHHEQLEQIRQDVEDKKHRHQGHARVLLRMALPLMAELAPVPTAVLMFADGLVDVHHAFRVHRLAREMSGSHEAKQILAAVHEKIDRLEPDRAEALIEMLMEEYRP